MKMPLEFLFPAWFTLKMAPEVGEAVIIHSEDEARNKNSRMIYDGDGPGIFTSSMVYTEDGSGSW
ncbi:MAG: hypothetical protein LBV12_12675 [Puniceicoccales bacterium]|jgi:hypothetical protein|nr:hypothetical protein [Puniceicoccales bacterium]